MRPKRRERWLCGEMWCYSEGCLGEDVSSRVWWRTVVSRGGGETCERHSSQKVNRVLCQEEDNTKSLMATTVPSTDIDARLGGSLLQPLITKTKVHKLSLEPEEIKL
ncbi:hypothetical protein Tco_0969048 [Tanacetum coccineum]